MTNNPTIDGVSRQPTPAMTEAGCQAYMDADGMIGIMHNSSMGHAYVAMRALDPEVAALQSTIAQLEDKLNKAIDLDFQRRETIEQLQALVSELERGLGGMLFAFDDGVGKGWSAKTLDYARKLTPAIEFDATAALNKQP